MYVDAMGLVVIHASNFLRAILKSMNFSHIFFQHSAQVRDTGIKIGYDIGRSFELKTCSPKSSCNSSVELFTMCTERCVA
jgi:hypothetical protein